VAHGHFGHGSAGGTPALWPRSIAGTPALWLCSVGSTRALLPHSVGGTLVVWPRSVGGTPALWPHSVGGPVMVWLSPSSTGAASGLSLRPAPSPQRAGCGYRSSWEGHSRTANPRCPQGHS